jgi:hypothetical protein
MNLSVTNDSPKFVTEFIYVATAAGNQIYNYEVQRGMSVTIGFTNLYLPATY